MPTFDATSPTMTRKVAGTSISVPILYSEGHVMTAAEAKFASSAVASAVGNAITNAINEAVKKLNAGLKKGETAKTPADLGWDIQAEYTAAFTSYKVGQSNRGSGTGTSGSDPVASLVGFLARAAVTRLLQAKNINVRKIMQTKVDGGGSKFGALVAEYTDRHPELVDQAKAQLANQSDTSADEDILGDLEGDSTPQAEAA